MDVCGLWGAKFGNRLLDNIPLELSWERQELATAMAVLHGVASIDLKPMVGLNSISEMYPVPKSRSDELYRWLNEAGEAP